MRMELIVYALMRRELIVYVLIVDIRGPYSYFGHVYGIVCVLQVWFPHACNCMPRPPGFPSKWTVGNKLCDYYCCRSMYFALQVTLSVLQMGLPTETVVKVSFPFL